MKLGIIGLSEGNGHPYSWAAICNGYDPVLMANCPFPVIPTYLAAEKWPNARLEGVEVTHIWTQDRIISQRVADATLIKNVCSEMTEMIGAVDAILLARDDPERHFEMAEPFLRAGLPIYIDKPVATKLATLHALEEISRYPTQIFTCSALRYARELQLEQPDRDRIGEVIHVDAVVPKSWEKYAVHVIEPALLLLQQWEAPLRQTVFTNEDQRHASFVFAQGKTLSVKTMGAVSSPLELRVFGTLGHQKLRFHATFAAFKASISAFVQQARTRVQAIPRRETTAIVRLIEKGLEV